MPSLEATGAALWRPRSKGSATTRPAKPRVLAVTSQAHPAPSGRRHAARHPLRAGREGQQAPNAQLEAITRHRSVRHSAGGGVDAV